MSNLVVSNISDGTTSVGTGYVVNGSAKAWARWSMAGTAANVDSFNISSFTDITTGVCKQTLTSSMSDGNYANVTTAGETNGGGNRVCGVNGSYSAPAATNTHFALTGSNLALTDVNYGAASWMGDLA